MKKNVLLVLLFLMITTVGWTQTPGLIIKPAQAPGKIVLDPDEDGYVSQKTNGVQIGFTDPPDNDVTQSEIPYVAIVRPDPSDDILRGPVDGFIEIVGTDAAGNNAILTYNDGTNILYRFRMGGYAPNSKSYSLLIDTDQRFGFTGENADPNAVSGNPGFEMEIVLKTNFTVDVYFVDGLTDGVRATTHSFDTHCQQSIAISEAGGDPDYFYDFFIPITDFDDPDLSTLNVDENTALRIVALTTMNPHEATGNNALSDIGGVTTGSNIDQIFIDLIDGQTPTPPGGEVLDRSDCPSIDPVRSTDTQIAGSSTEASGTEIEVFVYQSDGTTLIGSGTTTTSGTSWTIDVSALSPAVTLVDGQIIKATATATGEGESYDNCDVTTVASCGAGIIAPVFVSVRTGDKEFEFQIDGPDGTVVGLYDAATNNLATGKSGALTNNPYIVGGANPAANASLIRVIGQSAGSNSLNDGSYYLKATYNGCESSYTFFCHNTSPSAVPIISTDPISKATTSISGTGIDASAQILLYADGTQIGSATSAATSPFGWTIAVSDLTEGNVITARQIVSGGCISDHSDTVYVKRTGLIPTIDSDGCYSAVTVTTVSGFSIEEMGTKVILYDVSSGRSKLDSSTVLSGGTWTVTGLSLSSGDKVAATISSASLIESADSDTITIATKTSLSGVTITIDQPTDGETTASGTISGGSYPTTLRVYVDEAMVGSSITVSADGTWSVSGLTSFDLAVGSTVQVTLENASSCESDLSTANAIVSCLSPIDKTVSASSTTYCAEEYGTITVENSESGVIYTPVLASDSTTFGFSVAGDGTDIDLTTEQLSVNPTLLRVLASKFPYGSCEYILSDTVSFTVNPLPAVPSGSASQNYCASGTTTLVDLSVTAPNGSVVKWYDASSDGNSLAATTVLSNGTTYYAESENSTTGCKSSSRLAVTVAEGNPESPTGDASQTFCVGATVADLAASVAGPGTIIWYDASTGGDAYNSTDVLVNGNHYYGETTHNSCVSPSRLDVTASITASVGGDATASASSVCSGSSTTVTLSGETGSIQWQQSADGTSGWVNVTGGIGATTASYTTANLTATTYYRAAVTSGSCSAAYSDTVSVSVDAASVGGNATVTASNVCSGSNTTITLSGETGSIQWQQSADGTSGWVNVTGGIGATTASYTTANLTATTYYRAAVTSGSCSAAYSDTVSVSVDAASVGGNATVTASNVCSGSNTTITLSGETGSIRWQQSADGSSGWANVTGGSGATTVSYTTANLTATTYYRAVITSGSCSAAYSDTVSVSVDAASVGGNASADQTICNGDTPSSLSLSGSIGTILWQSSTDNISFADITGENATSLTLGAHTQDMHYRARVTSGTCATAYSDTVTVTVNDQPDNSLAVSDTTICNSAEDNVTITITGAESGVSYELQTTAGSSLSPAVSATGAGADLDLTILQANAPTSTTTYKVVATVDGCAAVDLTDQPTVTVNDQPDNSLAVGDATVDNPATGDVTITITGAESGVSYELQTTAGASLSPAVSATGAGVNLDLTILQANAPTSTTTYKVVATVGGCAAVDLTDQPTVTVTGNNAPDAVTDNETTSEDVENFEIDVADNDSDPEGDDLIITVLEAPTSGGTATVINDTIIYNPPADWYGVDTIVYRACDQGTPSLCDSDTAFVTVTPVNDAPAQGNETITVNEDSGNTTSGNLVANNTDPDGTAVTISSIVSSTGGATTSITGSGTTIDYEPAADFNGIDTVIYEVCDLGLPLPAACVNDTLFVTVTPVNDALAQGNETITVNEDSGNTTSGNLVANNTDPDGTAVTISSIVSSTGGSATSISGSGTTIDYEPAADFNGIDTVIYEVCDLGLPLPAACVNDTLFVSVTPVNDAPAQGNETLTVNEDSGNTTSGNLVANNTDPDGTAVTISSIVSSTGGATTSITGSGTTIDYEPAADFNGIDTVIYEVCDLGLPLPAACVNDTLFVSVTPVNDAPAQGNETLTVNEDSGNTTSGNLVSNNTDPDGTAVTISSIVSSTGGSATSISGSGTTIDYEPAADFNGIDTVIYEVCDLGLPLPAACVNDTLFVSVTPVNDAPAQGNETLTVNEDSGNTTSGNLVANNTDPDGTAVTISSIVSSTGGSATSISGSGTTIDYEPAADFNGIDTVIYEVCDLGLPLPAACVNDTLFVSVTPVNDAPAQGNETLTVNEDSGNTTSGNLVANNTDPDGTAVTISSIVSSTGGATTSITGSGTTIDYEPAADFNGIDTVIYEVCDLGLPLPAACVNDTLFVTVTPVNDAPAQGNETLTVNEDSGNTTSGNLVANNTDPDGTAVTISSIVSSTGGSATSISGSGTTIDYEPAADFNGIDTVIYEVCDLGLPLPAACVNDTLFVSVTPVNDAPAQGNETLTVNEDSGNTTSGNLVANNTDPDGTAVTISSIVSSTGGATTSITGSGTTIDYEPAADFNGIDTVIYEVCDLGLPLPAACVNDTLFVSVTPVNDAPAQGNETLTVNEDSGNTTSGNLVANNTDPDGTAVTISSIVSSTGGATTSITGSGTTIDYEPAADFNGIDTVIYEVCDLGLPLPAACVNDTLFVTVTPVNDAPAQGNETLTVNEDSGNTTSGNLVANNTDPDGAAVTISSIVSSTGGATTSITGSGTTIDYEPAADFNGIDTVIYEVCDLGLPLPAACVNDTLFVSVTPVNDAPAQGNETLTVNEDSGNTTSGNLVANNTDPDGTAVTISSIVSSTGGATTSITGSGTTIDYEPAADFNGIDTVIYEVCDLGLPLPAACVNDTLFVTVTPVNDAPAQGNETLTVNEDSGNTTSGNLVANNTDPDGTAVTISSIVSSTGGSATSISGSGTTIDYEPAADFNGIDTVIYEVCDLGLPLPAACVNDTLFVSVTPVNDAPAQGNETLTVNEDSGNTTSGNLVANNTDPDGTAVTISSIVSSTGGATTSITGSGTTIDYEPAADFNGIDTVIYEVCDLGLPLPAACVNDTLFVTVTPVNDAPAQGNETLTVNEDSGNTTSGNLVANNTDPDGTAVTISSIVSSTGGSATSISGSGTTIDYEPAADFNGIDTVIYEVCDLGLPLPAACVNDTLFVTVTPVNDAPAQGNETLTVNEDSGNTTSGNLVANNTDPDGTAVTISSIVSSTGGATTSITGSGTTIDYEPAADFNGIDTVIYEVCDLGLPLPAACVNDTLFVSVTPVNDAPAQGNETLTVNEDSGNTTSGNLVANNTDPDGTAVTISSIVSSTGGATTSITGSGTTIDYEPAADFNGIDTVIYEVCDLGLPLPAACVNDTLFVTVTPVNDAPAQGNETLTVNEDSGNTTSGNLVANNTDPDGAAVTISSIVSSTGGATTSITGSGTTIDYEPAADFNGIDTVIYEVCDLGLPLPAACVNDTLFVTVTPVNDAPAQGNETITVNEDSGNTTSGNLVANNTDPDGTAVTISSIVSSTGGATTSITGSGTTIDYEPAADFNGIDTVIYEVCDLGLSLPAACVNDTLFVTVTPVNDAPAQGNETITVNEDSGNTTSGNLVANNTDPDGTAVTISSIVSSTGGATTSITGSGTTIDYEPAADFNGIDTVIYEVCDLGLPLPAACVNDTLFVTVTPVNDAPAQGNETITVNEDSGNTTSGNLVANNTDPDGTAVTISSIVSSTGGATTSITGSGTTIDYEPAADFNGIDTVIYEVCDLGLPLPAACVNDTLFVTVTPVNDAPAQGNETITVNEDSGNTTSGNLVANNTDPDGTAVTISSIVSSTGGATTSITGSGTTIDYEPAADFNGIDTVIYEVCDLGLPLPAACVNDTLFVTVTPVNDAPAQGNETITVNEDSGNTTSGNLVANNTDPDGTAVTISSIVSSTGGATTSITGSGTTIDYEPAADFNGIDTVIYEVCDLGLPLPAACVNDTLFVTVTPVNDAPAQGNETITVNEDSGNTTSGNLVANNTDPDGTAVTISSIVSSTGGATTSITGSGTTIDYEPAADFNGIDTVIYEVCDLGLPLPAACVNDTLFVTVTPVNDAPAQGNETITVNEDSGNTTSGNLVANNTDPDGTAVTISSIVSSTGGSTTSISGSGTTIDYEPAADFNGIDTVIYEVCDLGLPLPAACVNDTLFVTVTPVNDAPAQGNETITVNEDSGNTTSGNLVANNTDPDGTAVTISSIVSSTGGATTSITGSGTTIDYEPAADFNGIDTVIYEVCDLGLPLPAACVNDTLFVTVTPVNDAPVAEADVATVSEDASVNIDVQDNDSDIDGDGLTTNIVESPENGTATVVGKDVTYTPNPNWFGEEIIIYEVCDPSGACDSDTIFITVNPVNDKPVANDDALGIEEGSGTTTVDVLANDSDPENEGLTITSLTPPVSGGTAIIVGDKINYTPPAGWFGTDTIEYEVCDDGTPTRCDKAMLYIYVGEVNDAPIANADTVVIIEDSGEIIVKVQENDEDPEGGRLTTTIVKLPEGGSVSVINGDSISYIPDADWFGNDTLIYQICDDGTPVLCDQDTVYIEVLPVNDAPVAVSDTATLSEDDDEVIIPVLDNDFDVEGEELTVSLLDGPFNGEAILNDKNEVVYKPNSDWSGKDSLTYVLCDNGVPSLCDTATVMFNVKPENDAPIANTDSVEVEEGEDTIVIDVLANDIDPEGEGLEITNVSIPGSGAKVSIENGQVVYELPENWTGTDTIIYEVCDKGTPVACDSDTIFVTVKPKQIENTKPEANPDEFTSMNGADISGNVLENDFDADGDSIILSGVIEQPSHGTLGFSENGEITYTPDPNYYSSDEFVYVACDLNENSLCDTAIVKINSLLDSDFDGLADIADPDDDNDDIKDVVDGDMDSDGDGLPNRLDIDSDNDGITDNEEAKAEGENEKSYRTIGADYLIPVDTDLDGIPDYLDLDSDNDGVEDLIEGWDANLDGTSDVFKSGIDDDRDGLDDAFDTIDDRANVLNPFGSSAPLQNSDDDNIRDWRDIDDDNDGIATKDEYLDEFGNIIDYDKDGIPDYLDIDIACELFIPDGFSPNEDGINDNFVVECISKYPNMKLEVYSRWGSLVFEKENFGNTDVWGENDAWWDGSSSHEWQIGGDKLPSATYFYILNFNSGDKKPVAGSVFINR